MPLAYKSALLMTVLVSTKQKCSTMQKKVHTEVRSRAHNSIAQWNRFKVETRIANWNVGRLIYTWRRKLCDVVLIGATEWGLVRPLIKLYH